MVLHCIMLIQTKTHHCFGHLFNFMVALNANWVQPNTSKISDLFIVPIIEASLVLKSHLEL